MKSVRWAGGGLKWWTDRPCLSPAAAGRPSPNVPVSPKTTWGKKTTLFEHPSYYLIERELIFDDHHLHSSDKL